MIHLSLDGSTTIYGLVMLLPKSGTEKTLHIASEQNYEALSSWHIDRQFLQKLISVVYRINAMYN